MAGTWATSAALEAAQHALSLSARATSVFSELQDAPATSVVLLAEQLLATCTLAASAEEEQDDASSWATSVVLDAEHEASARAIPVFPALQDTAATSTFAVSILVRGQLSPNKRLLVITVKKIVKNNFLIIAYLIIKKFSCSHLDGTKGPRQFNV